MTLSAREAHAVNDLLDLLLDESPMPLDRARQVARAQEAAVLLAGSAYKRLLGRWTPEAVRDQWLLPRACRECGCTDEWGCDDGCSWVGDDDLCTRCWEPTRDVVTVNVTAGVL